MGVYAKTYPNTHTDPIKWIYVILLSAVGPQVRLDFKLNNTTAFTHGVLNPVESWLGRLEIM